MSDVVEPSQFVEELRRTIALLVEAVGGPTAYVEIGYTPITIGTEVEHRFYVVVDRRVKGALVGRDGANAHRISHLTKTRATVLGSQERVDVKVIGHRSEAPAGVFA